MRFFVNSIGLVQETNCIVKVKKRNISPQLLQILKTSNVDNYTVNAKT